jgi:hypothetical protein
MVDHDHTSHPQVHSLTITIPVQSHQLIVQLWVLACKTSCKVTPRCISNQADITVVAANHASQGIQVCRCIAISLSKVRTVACVSACYSLLLQLNSEKTLDALSHQQRQQVSECGVRGNSAWQMGMRP